MIQISFLTDHIQVWNISSETDIAHNLSVMATVLL
jgi:hypothetical protein